MSPNKKQQDNSLQVRESYDNIERQEKSDTNNPAVVERKFTQEEEEVEVEEITEVMFIRMTIK